MHMHADVQPTNPITSRMAQACKTALDNAPNKSIEQWDEQLYLGKHLGLGHLTTTAQKANRVLD